VTTLLCSLCGKAGKRIANGLAGERGFALVMALGLLTVLAIAGTAVTYYSTSDLVGSKTAKSRASAYDLAEAGLNDAVATLTNQLNSDGSVKSGASSPITPTLLPSTTVQYAAINGSVTYSGTLNTSTYVWTITSTGKVKNLQDTQAKTLTKLVTVRGLNQGADGSSWSRFYDNDSDGSCLTIDGEIFVTNVATKGNLCIKNGGGVSGANTLVDVGGTVTISGPGPQGPHTDSGSWTSPNNVNTINNQYATDSINASSTSPTLTSTNFEYGITPNATVTGIGVTVMKYQQSGCCSSVQTISVTGSPTGGTFKLNATPPGGSSTATASIAYNASSGTVQSALVTIFGSGNVTCSGGSLPGTAVACTFAGADAFQPITLMTKNSTAFTGGSSPNVSVANTTTGVAALQDGTVQLLKAGTAVGNNKAVSTSWSPTLTTVTYGGPGDLWGTTWNATDIDNTSFGLQFIAKNVASSAATAAIDYISITVYYTPNPDGIGTPGTPIKTANIGGTCTYQAQAAHTPCSSTDHVYAGTITTTAPASNPALVMPSVDFSYWWANAKPGPKHFCTNPNPGIATTFFDNNASTTTGPDASITVNGEMAPATSDVTCQVVENGVLQGEYSWNHTTHVMTIDGTIFVDGNFRFDEDGEVVNYFGRANIMSSKDDEIDAVVCAGGTGTTDATSCLNNMSSWDPSQNMMVLMSEAPNEYDQGATTCSGNTPPTCYYGHAPGGFQGILYSTSSCEIHQSFQDSGPVICNSISLPNENGDSYNPTYYSFPSIGNLTDGQKYGNAANATNFEIDGGDQAGG